MNVLRGTGVCSTEAPELLLDPAPPPEAPSATFAVVDGRVVPAKEVLALDETVVDVLTLASTVGIVDAFAVGESAEVAFTVDAAVVVLTFRDASAELVEAGAETPAVEEALSSAFPAVGATPDPAPEEDPAVLFVVNDAVGLVADDWM